MFYQYYWLPRQQYEPKCHKLQSMYLLIEKKFPDYVRKKVRVPTVGVSKKELVPVGFLIYLSNIVALKFYKKRKISCLVKYSFFSNFHYYNS